MDLLIKDLELPEDGAYDYNLTIRSDGNVEGWQQVGERIVRINSWAVEVKPHGRLIDADNLKNTIVRCINDADKECPKDDFGLMKIVYESCLYHIEQAQTVFGANYE